jgi:hypothetical protein
MQQVACFNVWQLKESLTLLAALLHLSDGLQLG